MGGGPVGCYLAYKLLLQKNARVFVFESRKFERPQVIRIPFSVAIDLPEFVKNIMWVDDETRIRIFNSGQADDVNFWPRPGFAYWPCINIGLFQECMLSFLQNQVAYKNRFFYFTVRFDLEEMSFQSAINEIFPQDHSLILDNITAIYCTCGTYANHLRKELKLLEGKAPENKGHGIYLIYQNQGKENFLRNMNLIPYSKLSENGITYVASNNYNYDVQLYTYPVGDLSFVLSDIPDEFIQYAKYNSQTPAVDLTGSGLSNHSRQWFENYKNILINSLNKVGIELPSDFTKIKVFYASRSEYYWDIVATKIFWENDISFPVFFLGDSAGSTDYKFGLSMGRGFLAGNVLTTAMQEHNYDFDRIAEHYQIYWNSVISREFNQGPLLPTEPWIQYKYLIKGREVQFSQDKSIHYIGDEQYENYLNEY